MMATQVREHTKATGSRWNGDGGRRPRFSGDKGSPASGAAPSSTALIGLGAVLAAVTMLFIAFTTAYLARAQEAGWRQLVIPQVLWVVCPAVLFSSR
jgi:hypothetical protein